MRQRKFGSSLAEQLCAAGWQPSTAASPIPTPEKDPPEERRHSYINAPAIGRVVLDSENSLASVYEYLDANATVTAKPPTPFMTIVFPEDYLRYRSKDAQTILDTLPEHPFYDPDYANAPIECETERATVRRNRYRGQPGSSLGIVIRELSSAHYRLQDERDMLLDHMSPVSNAQLTTFKMHVGFINDCPFSELVRNIPLPDTLTFGPLQLVPSLMCRAQSILYGASSDLL